jgi:hypothetical protein
MFDNGTAISCATNLSNLILIPSKSKVGLFVKLFRRSIIWDGPVRLMFNWGVLGESGMEDRGSTVECGIEEAILVRGTWLVRGCPPHT